MKRYKATLACILFVIICPYVTNAFIFNSYHIKAKVIDDNGESIEGANVYISFEKDTSSGTKMTAIKGISDSEGKFDASGSGNGHISYGAAKEDYYMSNYTHDFPYQGSANEMDRDFIILLRKIENPVPMYARSTLRSKVEIPVIGKNVGFDLIVFDWVAPYGKGKQSDFIFHVERLPVITRKNYDATLTITFGNKYDGIQLYREKLQYGSQFKLPRSAPETGYEQNLVLHESFGSNAPTKYNFNFRADDLNYIFRIRSEEKNGKFERAMYGKIRSAIDFSAMRSKTAEIYLTYYLNPDYTRNLEFDPKRNLFGSLPVLERIIEP